MEPITAESPEAQSADLIAENIKKLKELFPDLVTEAAQGHSVNVDVLKQLVGDQTVTDVEEKYGLNWHGKRAARKLALTPSLGTLRPCPDDSVDWENTQNLFIEGDNLEVLKLLQKSYAGKVKLIYIDPPYNTGKDFVYPDNFKDNIRNYKQLTGQVDSEGRAISSNKEASGRFHTDWLNMMYPRLKVARNLLKDDGVIFMSIDDAEVSNLRKVCDEVFGEENRIAIICHKSRASVSNDKIISSNHNSVILYAKNGQTVFENRANFGLEPVLEGFNLKDELGDYKLVPVDGPGGAAKGNPHYTFLGVTGYWRFSEQRMEQMHRDGYIVKVGNNLQQKHYLKDAMESRKTDTTWWDQKMYTSTASSRLRTLMEGEPFDNPKPIELVQRMVELWSRNPGDVTLDFFAGSGTTGHALYEKNAKGESDGKFILVQLPEPLNPSKKEQKVAAEYCDKIGKTRNIAELTKERLRRAAAKIKAEHPDYDGDLGFRVFKLDGSNIKAWNAEAIAAAQTDEEQAALLNEQVDHLLADRTEDDILYELLLKLGLDLCVPIEQRKIASKTVYSVGAGVLMVCLADSITYADSEALAQGIVDWHKALAPATEVSCVFRDSGFADDKAKANTTAILEQAGLKKVRSI